MTTLADKLRAGRRLTAIGFDDGPFERAAGSVVPLVGAVCIGTRFEGLLWGETVRDGEGATDAMAGMLTGSKFASQVHVVLTDGIAVGGLNVIDLPALAGAVGVPCIAVMRRAPDRDAMRRAMERLPAPDRRWATVRRAGEVHQQGGFTFQVVGIDPDEAALVLGALTDRGNVPEPLRLAHLIGAAVVTGVSGKRA